MIGFILKSLFGCHSNPPARTNKSSLTTAQSIHQFTMKDIRGKEVSLRDFSGKVILVVNVASKCGLTPQYKDLEALYTSHSDKGLVILGFPANNFLSQEPGSEQEIEQFCQLNYGVSFPMFSKISVKGDDQHPLYRFITSKSENGVLDSEVEWNFQKYLFDRDGHLVTFFHPNLRVTEDKVMTEIDKCLEGEGN